MGARSSGGALSDGSDSRFGDSTSRPGDTFAAIGRAVGGAYSSLFRGAVWDFHATSFASAIRPLTNSLTQATPLITAGLGVAIGFRSGQFNIGGRGQMLMAAVAGGGLLTLVHLRDLRHAAERNDALRPLGLGRRGLVLTVSAILYAVIALTTLFVPSVWRMGRVEAATVRS